MKINYKKLSLPLILFSFLLFFLGFYLDENSAGAGSYEGDIINIWNNLQIFLANDLLSSVNHSNYYDSRTPLAYILHEVLNPYVHDLNSYRKSVFVISMVLPILFYLCLKQKYPREDNLLLVLISSLLLLSPYFRTSSYWGLEENYGLISMLLAFLSLNNFLKIDNKNYHKTHIFLFFTVFFSSCALYFDQKLAFISAICLLKIFTSKKLLQFKLLSIFYYIVLALPYIYLISLWGGLMPAVIQESRELGSKIFLDQLGFASTIIAFYLLPLILFKEEKIKTLIKKYLLNKRNYYLIFFFIIYLVYIIVFYDLGQSLYGKGLVKKIIFLLFDDYFLRNILIYFSFFFSWIIIVVYIENKLVDILTIIYLLFLSLLLWPMFQEYFDPLILLMAFTFFNSKLILTYKNAARLYLYLFLLLAGSNLYYFKLFN
jgi:hypothetical protein